jgi:hypothetical protein
MSKSHRAEYNRHKDACSLDCYECTDFGYKPAHRFDWTEQVDFIISDFQCTDVVFKSGYFACSKYGGVGRDSPSLLPN